MTDAPNPNMALWDFLAPTDRNFTKPITGKSYKGDSPNPTYVIRKLTEAIGPIGKNWGFTVHYDRVRLGKPHQVTTKQQIDYGPPNSEGNQPVLTRIVEYEIVREEYHEICLRFWFRSAEGDLANFDAIGGTPMLYMTRSGTWMHDEDAAKKSLTDAYTKGASWLGACADIFLGIFDSKLAEPPEDPHSQSQPPAPQSEDKPQSSGQRTSTTPAGW